jgi:hypothetical protein
MEHFIRVVMEKQDTLAEGLNDDVFPGSEVMETEQGATVFNIPLPKALSEQESEAFADKLVNYMTEQGYDDFDIECSMDEEEELYDEETYDDDNDFYEEYGEMWYNDDDDPMDEAEYQGRKVKLGKPMQGDVKKFKVYVKNPKGNIVKVNFGDPNMRIKKSNPARRRSFRARHNCDNPGPRHKARYWSCRKW